MRIFYGNGRVNFVDNNDVLVGYDWYGDCCEDYRWILQREEPQGLVGELLDSVTMIAYNAYDGPHVKEPDIDLEPFFFDTSYFRSQDNSSGWDDTRNAIFRLTNKAGENIYLILVNIHNGYYSHGFEVSVGGNVIRTGSL